MAPATLIEALIGVYRRSAGEILLADWVVEPKGTVDAKAMGVSAPFTKR